MTGSTQDGHIFLGAELTADGPVPAFLDLRFGNRHGLVAGATGTGKTVTLQALAEGFSRAGVAVLATDIKGDLSGLAARGSDKPVFRARADEIGLGTGWQLRATPTVFFDLFGAVGHPVRTTVSEMGPLLLSQLLSLNDTQSGVLSVLFKVADDQGLLVLDLKDLRALLAYLAENASTISATYGQVSKASIGAIQRALLAFEAEGGDRFFGEPALAVSDLMGTTLDGQGIVSLIDATRLMTTPRLYAAFLLWLLSELFETLPEVGDADRPKLVLFFDEAHLLFDTAPPVLIERIEQVVRLIRSKGVGVYFVTQNPLDLPDSVLGQLGNRVQHALRAFTPRDQRAVKAAADTFRPNPALDTARVLTELGVGEALVSTLECRGTPTMVRRIAIRPPEGRVGPLTPEERQTLMARSPFAGRYDTVIDRESAYELLAGRAAGAADGDRASARPEEAPPASSGGLGDLADGLFGTGRGRARLTPGQRMAREVTRSVATELAGTVGKRIAGAQGASIGRSLVRGLLGSLLGGR